MKITDLFKKKIYMVYFNDGKVLVPARSKAAAIRKFNFQYYGTVHDVKEWKDND